MPALAILYLDHPEVRVKAALFRNRRINSFLVTRGQDDPLALSGHQIEAALITAGLPIKGIELDQDRASRAITTLHHECRYLDQAQAR